MHALAVARGLLFTASDSGRVRAWAAPGCFNRGYLDVGRGRVPALAACGGTLVTSHSRDHHVRVWTVCAAAVCDHIRATKAATLPAKGGGLSLLSSALGGRRRRPHHGQHRDTVSCLVLHAVAGLLYTASHDHTVKAWKLSDGTCVDSFVAHDGPIHAMVVSEADGCVFTASADDRPCWPRILNLLRRTGDKTEDRDIGAGLPGFVAQEELERRREILLSDDCLAIRCDVAVTEVIVAPKDDGESATAPTALRPRTSEK